METMLGRRCYICNAIIADDNPDGIGCSCREAYNIAKYRWYEKNNPFSLWQTEVDIVLLRFLDDFAKTKFRSKFRKSFYPSIKKQYNETRRISRKQLEICVNILSEKIDISELYTEIHYIKKEKVEDYMRDFFEEANTDELAEFRNYINTSRQRSSL